MPTTMNRSAARRRSASAFLRADSESGSSCFPKTVEKEFFFFFFERIGDRLSVNFEFVSSSFHLYCYLARLQ